MECILKKIVKKGGNIIMSSENNYKNIIQEEMRKLNKKVNLKVFTSPSYPPFRWKRNWISLKYWQTRVLPKAR